MSDRSMAITIYSIPKPFLGHIGMIQRNAIRSWTQLQPKCEILLFGDDEGTADSAAEFDVQHIPEVRRNEHGTPLLDDVFRKAQANASNHVLCYVNADIILMSDLLVAVSRVHHERFLLLGQRWDLDVRDERRFEEADWEDELVRECKERGTLHGHTGVDYYVFPKSLWGDIPPFAIGRYMYDNWLIWKARAKHVPVIDASAVVTCVHQNHDRTYRSLGKEAPNDVDHYEFGVEAAENLRLAGGRAFRYTLRDATWRLTPKGLKRAWTPWHVIGRARTEARRLTIRLGLLKS